MDQKLERLEQIQKDMQDQLQAQLHEQLAKVQQDMKDKKQESQRSMIKQLTQLLARGTEKGISTVNNSGDDNEDPIYPLGFTPSKSIIAETAIESVDYLCGVDAKELSLAPDLVLPPKFKTPELEKYNETSCLETHITMNNGHSIENRTTIKKLIERFITMRIVRLNDPLGPNVAGNLLPSHSDQGVNAIIENRGKKTKIDVAKEVPKGMRSYYEFHAEEGHEIQECTEFRALVQSLMDNKELEFFEDVKGSEGEDICTTKEGSKEKVHKKPVAFPYNDSKRVLWNYDYNMMIPGEENSFGTLEECQDICFYMHSGRRYDLANAKTKPTRGKTLAVE
ncbi:hypothetical protein EPI10_024290 [Gossypium australe]|uniref:Uncharacterized protein n=1 Tax=Gossypium australe TaxID=47621 RepID=A0A5B6VYA4_9ROSI|nr:hypothetical protein EPI10_024290 [Gossypium australe]